MQTLKLSNCIQNKLVFESKLAFWFEKSKSFKDIHEIVKNIQNNLRSENYVEMMEYILRNIDKLIMGNSIMIFDITKQEALNVSNFLKSASPQAVTKMAVKLVEQQTPQEVAKQSIVNEIAKQQNLASDFKKQQITEQTIKINQPLSLESEVSLNRNLLFVGDELFYFDGSNNQKWTITDLFDGGFTATDGYETNYFYFDELQKGWTISQKTKQQHQSINKIHYKNIDDYDNQTTTQQLPLPTPTTAPKTPKQPKAKSKEEQAEILKGKKITLATMKAFANANTEDLWYINISEFDGMTDGVESTNETRFIKITADEIVDDFKIRKSNFSFYEDEYMFGLNTFSSALGSAKICTSKNNPNFSQHVYTEYGKTYFEIKGDLYGGGIDAATKNPKILKAYEIYSKIEKIRGRNVLPIEDFLQMEIAEFLKNTRNRDLSKKIVYDNFVNRLNSYYSESELKYTIETYSNQNTEEVEDLNPDNYYVNKSTDGEKFAIYYNGTQKIKFDTVEEANKYLVDVYGSKYTHKPIDKAAEELAEKLMLIENDAFDQTKAAYPNLDWQSFLQKYVMMLNIKLQPLNLGILSQDVYDHIENENYHRFNNYLSLKGYFGDEMKESYIKLWNESDGKNNQLINPTFVLGNMTFEKGIDSKYVDKVVPKTQSFTNCTFYIRQEMFGIRKIVCKTLTIESVQYAQYNNALKITFLEVGKRKETGTILTYKPFALVVAGQNNPEPDSAFIDTTKEDSFFKTSKSKYSANDSRYVSDFVEKIFPYIEKTNTDVLFYVNGTLPFLVEN